ncbi:Cyclin-dependent kinases regulatory subunit (Cell division control protein cks1) [Hanseniaspora osmophila]|uniref:Cyclin-dependent kinases regulatory subunit n=1 Tax=Hanseniaspora osmophila TaxID=56408 RepID=A0A1E5RFK3_9ASCO|nr:Cyclin-dependent kinases regulatory subunit [Hanseniaspora osmophila]
MSYYDTHPFQGRRLTDQERARVLDYQDSIHYSPRYSDDTHEYRHVMLPKAMLKVIPTDYFNGETGTLRILTEDEWRGLGVTQSLGWAHYECHTPEPHILLFRRPINFEQELKAQQQALLQAQQLKQQQQQ